MIIDNKEYRNEPSIKTVWGFFEDYFPLKGKFDIVTGYFTIRALSELNEKIDSSVSYRILSSELVKKDKPQDCVIDLLRGDMGIENTLNLDKHARNAIEFLNRDNVKCRAITNAFCHAKAYLYHPVKNTKGGFFLTGSPNLTEAGLGLERSSNLELAIGKTADKTDSDFLELSKWFDDTWNKASETLPVDKNKPRGEKIGVKEYFIKQIKDFFREYSPKEIYYKILFELFKKDLEDEQSLEHQKEMQLLEDSVIWNTLYKFQQQGVISLIKMLRKYNGAILADAVGLGKTFSALAVIKYFQNQNYKVLVLSPKKLNQNWEQYRGEFLSRFLKDEFQYRVRFHTDLQDDRLSLKNGKSREFSPEFLQKQDKVLVVIDESHNLRNEKSSRYISLMRDLIRDSGKNRDVKVLMLSATPINTSLKDLKSHFKLIAKDDDRYFANPVFGINSLWSLFSEAQRKYKDWIEDENRTIGGLINELPNNFFNLTDKLIVARTRNIITNVLGEKLNFPAKAKPVNVYQSVDHFGNYHNADAIYKAFDNLFLSAYQPHLFRLPTIKASIEAGKGDFNDNVKREHFLVKMMEILFLKRLESSWYSLLLTVEKILNLHEKTLDRVNDYLQNKNDSSAMPNIEDDEEQGGIGEEDFMDFDFSIGKNGIKLSSLKNIKGFQEYLQKDVKDLTDIYNGLLNFKKDFEINPHHDLKFSKLIDILRKKQSKPNKKVVIFTVYYDTAKFLFDELRKVGFDRIAMASGSASYSSYSNQKADNYQNILKQFAPYSKLFKELDWSDLYEKHLKSEEYYDNQTNRWNVPFEIWEKLIQKHVPDIKDILNQPIDILIATDCLSEGQNLQDADMQINYDIHWNPVRLIQRFGRIDRIGSPNKLIQAVNFWPAKDVNEYLDLEDRVKNRMAIMNLGGGETIDIDPDYNKIVKDNPLGWKNAQKLLTDMQTNTLSDIEDSKTLTLTDLSMEAYRQDLEDFFDKNKETMERIPNGVFSGFEFDSQDLDKGEFLVGLLGYPKREEGSFTPYEELYLMCHPIDRNKKTVFKKIKRPEILDFLRKYKNSERNVSEDIYLGDPAKIKSLVETLKDWFNLEFPFTQTNAMADLLMEDTISDDNKESDDKLIEDKFNFSNFDLIVWEYVKSANI